MSNSMYASCHKILADNIYRETVQYTNIFACQVAQNIAYKYTVTTTLTHTSQEKTFRKCVATEDRENGT